MTDPNYEAGFKKLERDIEELIHNLREVVQISTDVDGSYLAEDLDKSLKEAREAVATPRSGRWI